MKISNSCYGVLGLGCYPPWTVNSGFIVGTNYTLVVDSGPNYLSAQTIYGYAKGINPNNELLVINTEKHLDHIGGNSYFRERGIDIHGHKDIKRNDKELYEDVEYLNSSIQNIKRRMNREGEIFYHNTTIVNPNIPLENDMDIDLGEITAKIILTPGHTTTNLSVFIPEEGVLFCGDCIVNQYIPNLESGRVNDWQTWLKSLEKISSMKLNFVVPGHGNVISSISLNNELIRISKILENAIQNGKAPTV